MTDRVQQLLSVIAQDLQDDCTDYQCLHDLMQALHQQLVDRNSQQIDLLINQINPLIAQSRQRAERRSKVLSAFGLGAGAQAMHALLERYPQPQREQLHQVWDSLGELTVQCKNQNERNGKLLAMQSELLEKLLDEPGNAHLYKPEY
ncbi:flagellar protein FlgN [Pseudomonas sp. TTU2014-080ASC]|uniref:flagellar protein FlgN n=1 Tax=Pseudomonas sp. TTU2014-080ASC TaxID=1729724 RepID=UPI000718326D|nr:flagellar protein FlgN [Pseudomonas sp. TTU2014-080ASC]KRW61183.1 flagellar biosynthesis/type III secretory pathway chaperone [Pseudomonas sp. TTU2014-080ASC]